jgi:hypothetical protein
MTTPSTVMTPNAVLAEFFQSRGTLRVATDLGHSIQGYHAGRVDKTNALFPAAIVAAMRYTDVLGLDTSFMNCLDLWHKLNDDKVSQNFMLG